MIIEYGKVYKGLDFSIPLKWQNSAILQANNEYHPKIASNQVEVIRIFIYIICFTVNNMGKKSFLLVSLEEDKTKKLTTVLSNDKCRRILDYFSDNDSVTETQVAKDLKLPLSTVHYNIQQLVKTNLIESDEFHYSAKGKEVQHYSLANKYIIISPKPIYGIKQKLKKILPIILGITEIAWIIKLFEPLLWKPNKTTFVTDSTTEIKKTTTPTKIR